MFSVAHRLRCDCYVDICGKKAKKKNNNNLPGDETKAGKSVFCPTSWFVSLCLRAFPPPCSHSQTCLPPPLCPPCDTRQQPACWSPPESNNARYSSCFCSMKFHLVWFWVFFCYRSLQVSFGRAASRLLSNQISAAVCCHGNRTCPPAQGTWDLVGRFRQLIRFQIHARPRGCQHFFFIKCFFYLFRQVLKRLRATGFGRPVSNICKKCNFCHREEKKKKVNVCQLHS